MKIVFVGCVESSYRLLDTLLRNKQNVVGVITKKNQVRMLILKICQYCARSMELTLCMLKILMEIALLNF